MKDENIIDCEANESGVFEQIKNKHIKSSDIIVYSDKHTIQQNMESFKEGLKTGVSFVHELVEQVNKLKKLTE